MKIPALILVSLSLLSACATRPPATDAAARAAYDANHDPFEPANRAIFRFNTALDEAVVRPTAVAYRKVTPLPVRKGVNNFLSNWWLPYVFSNELLQFQPRRAATTFERFAVNTTIGFGGVTDPASKWGLEKHDEDFGQTFAAWGWGDGPYLMLPFFGPSNPRDFTGRAIEFFYEPVDYLLSTNGYVYESYTRTGMRVLTFRERNMEIIDNEARNSVDYYAAVRQSYYQLRCSQIHNGDASKCGQSSSDTFPDDFDSAK